MIKVEKLTEFVSFFSHIVTFFLKKGKEERAGRTDFGKISPDAAANRKRPPRRGGRSFCFVGLMPEIAVLRLQLAGSAGAGVDNVNHRGLVNNDVIHDGSRNQLDVGEEVLPVWSN